MNLTTIIVGICSVLFFMIGADKFLAFLEPPCSLTNSIPAFGWKVFGVLQLAAGALIWAPKFRSYIVNFFFGFMVIFIIVHLLGGTYDVGGAAFMAILLGLLIWNPSFIQSKKNG